MKLVVKDPDSIEPRGFDYTAYLAELAATETILASTWSVSGGDIDVVPQPLTILTVGSDSIVTGGLKTQIKLSAGTPGQRYIVTNRIVTSSGAVPRDDRSFQVLVQDR